MNALVVYCSQTGSARTYAAWLAEDLGCDAVTFDQLDARRPACDLVVLCSWFHAASIKGAKRFRAYMGAHPNQRFAVVAVGANPMPCADWPAAEKEEAFRHSFPADSYPDLPWCYCQGGFHFEKLGTIDKIAMRIYFAMLQKEVDKGSKRDAVALRMMREGFDGCNRAYLEPLKEQLGI